MARKLTWLLIASGLLNVLLIGVVAGNFFARRFHPPHRPPDLTRIEPLSPASARLLDETMAQIHEQNRALRGDFKTTRSEIFEALAAPEFDRDVYLNRVRKLHDLHGQRVMNMAEGVAAVAPHLTPEERAALAHQMQLDQPPPPHRPPPRRPPDRN